MSTQRMLLADSVYSIGAYVSTVPFCFEWKSRFRSVLKMNRPKDTIVSEW